MIDPYFSELKYLGGGNIDFIEIAVPAGMDVSTLTVTVYNPDGSVRTTNALGPLVNTISGRDVYVVDKATSATFNGVHKLGAVSLDNNGTLLSFLSFEATVTATGGVAAGQTSTPLGATGAGNSFESTDGSNYTVQTTPNSGTVPCFLEGTAILTPNGYRKIETLQIGDKVVTRNNGTRELRWIGSREITASHGKNPNYLPVMIPANALAPGVPDADLYLSPNHRIMMRHPQCALLFGETEVLLPAKSLLGHNGIEQLGHSYGFRYFHILFDQHEVVFSNSLTTESFHPAHVGLGAFAEDTRQEVLSLFPDLCSSEDTYGPTARMALKTFEASILVDNTLQKTPKFTSSPLLSNLL